MPPALPPADRLLLLTVTCATFLVRWATLDFENDYFMHMAWAAEMLRGQWPVRDFVEPGFPLQTWLAFAALKIGGYQLAWEGFIATSLIAASAGLTYVLCRRLGIGRGLSLVAVIIVAATFPRLYAYPKAFVYPAALLALLHYQLRRTTAALVIVGIVTAVAFLFRHDHGVWIVTPTILGLALCHWREPRRLATAVVGYGLVALLVVSPWLLWVAVSGQSGQYWAFLLERSDGLTDRARLPADTFRLDGSAPLIAMSPLDYPIVGVRWSPAATAEERRTREGRYHLEAQPENPGQYRLTRLDSDNLRALVSDPLVEDTSGIDRGSLHVPDGGFEWAYLQLQRFVPIVRLRVLPGFIKAENAEPWLTTVTFFIPWIVLITELLRVVITRRPPDSGAAFVVPAAALSIITYQTLVRASPDSRLGDIAAITAVLLAWTTWRVWSFNGVAGRALEACTVIVVVLTVASALTYGRLVPRLAAVGVDGPTNLVRRLSGVGGLYATRPLDLYAPPDAKGLSLLSRWLNECTIDTDRVALIGFEPQVFFLAERGFAGGLAFYDLGWNSTERDQALVIDRWSKQRSPVVLAMDVEWGSFSRDYPSIRAWIDARYRLVQHSAFGGGKPLTVLLDHSVNIVGTHHSTGLPCFR